MRAGNSSKITFMLQMISIVPLFFFAIAILILSYSRFSTTINAEIETEMHSEAQNLKSLFDLVYPGDYRLVQEEYLRLYKGDSDITDLNEIFDAFKENTSMDATLFYQDTRIMTTIHDAKTGRRLIGTSAPQLVLDEVLQTGEAHFYTNTIINNAKYFSYYMPVANSDGSIIGMVFVGRPSEMVKNSVQQAVLPLLYIVILVMVIIAVCLYR